MSLTLKNHPFAVEAFFESSIVLTFSFPKEDLQKLIPPCLQLDCLNDQFAFIAVAMVQTTGLRPKGFPKFMGNDFFLIGYRVFVQYINTVGKRLRGLYILKSETDKSKMELLGNIFTHYNYSTTDIIRQGKDGAEKISSVQSKFEVSLDIKGDQIPLPENSPFTDWKEARRFAGPLPFTFTYNSNRHEVLLIEGVRQNWTPTPIAVTACQFSFFDELALKKPVLANAFIINNIPYFWKKGVIEQWNP